MDHRPARQWHRANRQGQPVRFDRECRDRQRGRDTRGNRDPVYGKSVLLMTVQELRDHSGAPAARPVLWRYREVWHRRLAGYLPRPDARHNIPAGCLAAVYDIFCSLTTLRQWFKLKVFRTCVVRAWTDNFSILTLFDHVR